MNPPPRQPSRTTTCSSGCAPPRRCLNRSQWTPASSTRCRHPTASACSKPLRAFITLTTSSAATSERPLRVHAVPRPHARAMPYCMRPVFARCAANRYSLRPHSLRRSASRHKTSPNWKTAPAAIKARAQSRSIATSASRTTRRIHHFYDQLCPACAELNFRKRTELADLRGRVALLTGGRVKIGYQAGHQAAARRRAPDRHHPLPARLGGALRAGAGLRGVGPSAGDLRPGSAPHAERGGVLPAPADDPRSAWTSSSTTPARPCGVRRIFTST